MKFKLLLISLVTVFLFTGCVIKEVEMKEPSKRIVHTYSLDETIIALADVLSNNLERKNIYSGNLAITSFVQLSDFSKTSKFGRLLSESLFNELNVNEITLLDFRARKSVTVNPDGEFYLSRDTKLLRKSVKSKYILIGTYSKNKKRDLLINARIINTLNGLVVSTSSVIYHNYNCKLFNDCKSPNTMLKLTSTKMTK